MPGGDVIAVDTAGRLHAQTGPDGRVGEVPARDQAPPRRGATQDPALRRRDDGSERAAAGAPLQRAVGVTGIALTKLNGSAKGGIAVAIVYELGLPVKLVGVGEGLEDLTSRALVPVDRRRRAL